MRWFLILMFGVALSYAAIDTVYLEIAVEGQRAIPLGLVHIEGTENIILHEAPHKTLERDFFMSGRFAPVVLPQYNRMTFYQNRVAYFVSGKITSTDDKQYELELKLIAVQSLTLVTGQSYKVPLEQVRQALHDFADMVSQQLTGYRGVASSRLAWVSKIRGYKQIVVGDYDGYNAKQATTHPSINTMPTWDRNLNKIYFTSFRNDRPQIFSRDFNTGRVQLLFPHLDQTFSPAASPTTDELVFTVSKHGRSNLWIADTESLRTRQLSYQRANETSPAWAPNGYEVLFSADRGGSPQIYAMDNNGGDMRRVTFVGHYNESASWSPLGGKIVYSSQDPGGFNIYTSDLAGGEVTQLTMNAGNNEHPVWSPDGMMIAFSSNRTGSYQIYVMRQDGSGVTRITGGTENTWPSWAPSVNTFHQESQGNNP
ncbi:MAG: translocation protein TolB [Fibrobacter sp.]|nr:translocation protein TolB [Fibrobacter sp.]